MFGAGDVFWLGVGESDMVGVDVGVGVAIGVGKDEVSGGCEIVGVVVGVVMKGSEDIVVYGFASSFTIKYIVMLSNGGASGLAS